MFEKKQTIEDNEAMANKQDVLIKTIPADFYGGANPVIKFRKVVKEIDVDSHSPKKELTMSEEKDFDRQTAPGQDNLRHPVNLLANRKFLSLGGLAVFILFIGGVGAYYWHQSRKINKAPEPLSVISVASQTATSSKDLTASAPAPTTPVLTSDISTSTVKDLLAGPAIEFPSKLLGYAADLDNDKLTDKEEEIFGSDASFADSDKDGYQDGYEVYYLYNPNGEEPRRLIDAGTVKEYKNPSFGYTLYYPAAWSVGNVDANYQTVLFTALSGESAEMRVFDLKADQTFADWFSLWAPNEKSDELENFTGVFKQQGQRRKDELVYYFIDKKGERLYLLLYHSSPVVDSVNYREIITMMARSFRLADNDYVKEWPLAESNATSTLQVSPLSALSTSSIATTTETATTSL